MLKKTIFIGLIFMKFLWLNAQDSLKHKTKDWRNQIGIDASMFIKNYLILGNPADYSEANAQPYSLIYRRKQNMGNWRIALGVNYTNERRPSGILNDTSSKTYLFINTLLNMQAGYEFISHISNRWQVFYGADITLSYNDYRNDFHYSNGGFIYATLSRTKRFGAAPFMGLRFKINNRLSLITESSLQLIYSEKHQQTKLTKIFSGIPDPVQPKATATKSTELKFLPPLFLILSFSF